MRGFPHIILTQKYFPGQSYLTDLFLPPIKEQHAPFFPPDFWERHTRTKLRGLYYYTSNFFKLDLTSLHHAEEEKKCIFAAIEIGLFPYNTYIVPYNIT